ncbi:hypothetical protein DFH29DRAFT_878233 [Suillus ampliporus]|nr:hypothetical protein DFH29DRAFT_878233 [Suillus ampliporus]
MKERIILSTYFQQGIMEEHYILNTLCICYYICEQDNGPTCLVYFGFHYSNGQLVLDRFLNIWDTLDLSLHTEIYSAPILFIYLKIVDYDAMVGEALMGAMAVRQD